MRDSFSAYHPLVVFIYFTSVTVFSIFFMNPALLAISAACAFSYCVCIGGRKAAAYNLMMTLFMSVTAVMINMLFNHRGMTTLFFLRGNPVTLESAVFGASAGLMLAVTIMWFSCFGRIMTSDRIMYLFGRISPLFSLLFSMILRFVPRFAKKAREISEAQIGIKGISGEEAGSRAKRIKSGLLTSSILTAWALENSVDTAVSMRSRGYGLSGRTAFSFYRFDRSDIFMTALIAALDGTVAAGMFAGKSAFGFFPMIKAPEFTTCTAGIFAAYLLLGLLPMITNMREEIKWRYLQSKI